MEMENISFIPVVNLSNEDINFLKDRLKTHYALYKMQDVDMYFSF